MLNVHAKSSVKWPDKQEIAELNLSFVELASNITPIKLAIITLAPVVTGLASIWLIANNILNFNQFFQDISSGRLEDVASAFTSLTSAPDFWLWIYLLFVISNTMTPNLRNLRGLRFILIGAGVALAFLFVVGAGRIVLFDTLAEPLADALNLISGTFIVIILVDLAFVVILGTVEAIIERATGDSATFKRGKLIAVTRQERLEEQRRQRQRETRAALRSRNESRPERLPTIYSRELDIPGPPGTEPVTQGGTVIMAEDDKTAALPRPDDRSGPDIIMQDDDTPPTSSAITEKTANKANNNALPAVIQHTDSDNTDVENDN